MYPRRFFLLLCSLLLPSFLAAPFAASHAAVTMRITYTDGQNEGFNHPVLGAQRKQAFSAAVSNWARRLTGTVPIEISASFDPLGLNNGSGGGSTLAQCGPTTFSRDWAGWFSGMNPPPRGNTWYPIALANQLAGKDIQPTMNDMTVQCNSDWDASGGGFYYGLDANPPGNQTDFYSVIYHELGHGLGFLDSWNQDGTFGLEPGYASIFDVFMAANYGSGGEYLTKMKDNERAAALTGGTMWFAGANASLGASDASCRLWAPNPYQTGSSGGHLDENLFSGTDELMTPFASSPVHQPGPRVTGVFRDMGWGISSSDTTKPNLTITSPADNSTSTTLGTITGTATDGNAGMSRVALRLQRASDGLWWTGGGWSTNLPEDQAPLLTPTFTLSKGAWSYATVPSGATLPLGSYTIIAYAWDRAANQKRVSSKFIIAEQNKPTPYITSPMPGQQLKSLATAVGYATDDSGVTTVRVALRRESDMQWWNRSLNGGAGDWDGTEFDTARHTISVTPTTVSGSSPPRATWSVGLPSLPPGNYSVWANASDASGNHSEYTGHAFTLDTTGPDVSVTAPAHGSFVKELLAISGEASDAQGIKNNQVVFTLYQNGDFWTGTAWKANTSAQDPAVQLKATVVDGAWTYTSVPSGATLRDGQYFISTTASDPLDNLSPSLPGVNQTNFRLDNNPPQCAITSPANGTPRTGALTISGTASDSAGIEMVAVYLYRYSDGKFWDGRAWGGGGSAILSTAYDSSDNTWRCNGSLPQPGSDVATSLTTGSYNVIAIAYDKAGNTTRADSVFSHRNVFTWTGYTLRDNDPNNNSRSWGTPLNWSPIGVPGADDDAILNNGDEVGSTVSRTVRRFEFIAGTLSFGGNALTATEGLWVDGWLSGTWNVPVGGTLLFNGSTAHSLGDNSAINNSGTITWESGPIRANCYNGGATITNTRDAIFNIADGGTVFTRIYGSYTPVFVIEAGAKLRRTGGAPAFNATLHTFHVNVDGTVENTIAGSKLEFAGNATFGDGSVFTGAGMTNFTAGTKALSGTISVSGTALEWEDGTYDGAPVTIKTPSGGRVNWNGGTLRDTFTVDTKSTLNLVGDGAKKMADNAVLNNKGTVVWNPNGSLQANCYNGPATFNNINGATFRIAGDGTVFTRIYGSYTPVFNNSAGAKLQKNSGTGEAAIHTFTLNNSGLIENTSGALNFSGQLNLNNGGRLLGSGAQKWTSGQVLLTGTTLLNAAPVTMTGGELVGATDNTGTLTTTNSGVFDWQGGDFSRTVNFGSGAFKISGTGSKRLGDNAVLNNKGRVTWTGSGPLQANCYNGPSTINNLIGGLWTIADDTAMTRIYGSYSPSFNNNSGATVVRNTTTGVANISNWLWNNDGTTQVLSGVLSFGHGGNSGGRFDVRGTAVARFVDGTHTWRSGVELTGISKTEIAGATVRASGTISCTGGGATGLLLSSGALIGDSDNGASLIGKAPIAWTGGGLGGQIKTASTLTTNISGEADKLFHDGARWDNAGVVNWSGGLLKANCYNGGATLNNLQGATFNLNADGVLFSRIYGSYTPVFNNNFGARFVKMRGSAASSINTWTFNNDGVIQTATAVLEFNGSRLNLNNGSRLQNSGQLRLATDVQATGTINTIGGRILLDAGSLTANPAIYSGTGVLDWKGGSINGDLTFAAGTTASFADGATPTDKVLDDGAVINNNGTITVNGAGRIVGNCYNGPATINNNRGGKFNLNTTAQVFARRYSSYAVTFNNAAQARLAKVSGGNTVPWGDCVLNNGAYNGTTFTAGGEIFVGGGTLQWDGDLNLNGGTLTGNGRHAWNGTTRLRGTVALGAHCNLIGGVLVGETGTGLGTPTVSTSGSGQLNWSGGSVAGQLNIANNAVFNMSGTGAKKMSDNAIINNNGVATLSGALNANCYNGPATFTNGGTGTLTLNSGASLTRLYGNHVPSLTNNGLLVLNSAPAALECDWNFAHNATGTLRTQIASATSFGRLNLARGVNLAGTVNPNLLNNYAPPLGTAFKVLSHGNGARTGTFSKVINTGSTTRALEAVYTADNVTLTTISAGPVIVSLLPATSTNKAGTPRAFSAVFSDPNGAANITQVIFHAGASQSVPNALRLRYDAVANKLYLRDNADTAWLGGFAPGSANTISNSQGSLDCSTATVSLSGNNLTLRFTLTPAAALPAQTLKLYLQVQDAANLLDGFKEMGTWTITAGTTPLSTRSTTPLNQAPQAINVAPASLQSATGETQNVTTLFRDANGAADIANAQAVFGASLEDGLRVRYDAVSNKLWVWSGGAWQGGFAPGSAHRIVGENGTLNCENTEVSLEGDDLVISWAISLEVSGTQTILLRAEDKAGAASKWQSLGEWTVNP